RPRSLDADRRGIANRVFLAGALAAGGRSCEARSRGPTHCRSRRQRFSHSNQSAERIATAGGRVRIGPTAGVGQAVFVGGASKSARGLVSIGGGEKGPCWRSACRRACRGSAGTDWHTRGTAGAGSAEARHVLVSSWHELLPCDRGGT